MDLQTLKNLSGQVYEEMKAELGEGETEAKLHELSVIDEALSHLIDKATAYIAHQIVEQPQG